MFELVDEDQMLSKRCLGCGEPLPEVRQIMNAMYCDANCRNHPKGISSATAKGSMAEIAVAMDLIAQGFYVYRPLHQSAPCDLIAQMGDQFFRVEVKSAATSARYGQPMHRDCATAFDAASQRILSTAQRLGYQTGECAWCRRPKTTLRYVNTEVPGLVCKECRSVKANEQEGV